MDDHICGNPPLVCIHTDASRTIVGRCGDDEPTAIIPTSFNERRACINEGQVSDWGMLQAAWAKGLEYVQVC